MFSQPEVAGVRIGVRGKCAPQLGHVAIVLVARDAIGQWDKGDADQ